ncbi:MAG: manganese efflux pump [Oscillospiraceae bacterium]|nr:manganese efflux pump [Oscillospiraceae bacterium]
MNFGVIFFLNSLLLGVGLSMDAFSISLANGLLEPQMRLRKMFGIAAVFAFFQALMPLIGWACVHTAAQHFSAFGKLIPWIALVLLCGIGGNMLLGGIKKKDDISHENVGASLASIIVQGIATSIDALSVGFTISGHNMIQAVVSALIIGSVTLVICFSGVFIGKKFGDHFANKADILGGAILIFIGLEIFISSF